MGTQPTLVLEHTGRLKQLLEYVLHLPPAVAAPMLRSLLPLQRQRPELRDQLVRMIPTRFILPGAPPTPASTHTPSGQL